VERNAEDASVAKPKPIAYVFHHLCYESNSIPFQSPACQESDWQQHRELCLKSSTFKSPPDNLPSASAWGYHVAPQLSALALKIVGLDKLAPLPAANRKEIWERQSQKFCLLVQLRIVDKPGRKGPVKRHEYISSEKVSFQTPVDFLFQ
jgi:hypothetical protein